MPSAGPVATTLTSASARPVWHAPPADTITTPTPIVPAWTAQTTGRTRPATGLIARRARPDESTTTGGLRRPAMGARTVATPKRDTLPFPARFPSNVRGARRATPMSIVTPPRRVRLACPVNGPALAPGYAFYAAAGSTTPTATRQRTALAAPRVGVLPLRAPPSALPAVTASTPTSPGPRASAVRRDIMTTTLVRRRAACMLFFHTCFSLRLMGVSMQVSPGSSCRRPLTASSACPAITPVCQPVPPNAFPAWQGRLPRRMAPKPVLFAMLGNTPQIRPSPAPTVCQATPMSTKTRRPLAKCAMRESMLGCGQQSAPIASMGRLITTATRPPPALIATQVRGLDKSAAL